MWFVILLLVNLSGQVALAKMDKEFSSEAKLKAALEEQVKIATAEIQSSHLPINIADSACAPQEAIDKATAPKKDDSI